MRCLIKKNKPKRVVLGAFIPSFYIVATWSKPACTKRESDVGSHDIIISPLLSYIDKILARCDKIK